MAVLGRVFNAVIDTMVKFDEGSATREDIVTATGMWQEMCMANQGSIGLAEAERRGTPSEMSEIMFDGFNRLGRDKSALLAAATVSIDQVRGCHFSGLDSSAEQARPGQSFGIIQSHLRRVPYELNRKTNEV